MTSVTNVSEQSIPPFAAKANFIYVQSVTDALSQFQENALIKTELAMNAKRTLANINEE